MNVTPFLMFTGQAEQAMRRYASVFGDAEIVQLELAAGAGEGAAATVQVGVLRIGNDRIRCFDSPAVHDFGFTPAVSLFVDCETAADVARLTTALADGGQVLMPLDSYPFADSFAWVADRFRVSWQLSFTGGATSSQ